MSERDNTDEDRSDSTETNGSEGTDRQTEDTVDEGSTGSSTTTVSEVAGDGPGQPPGGAVDAQRYPALRTGWMVAETRGRLRKLTQVHSDEQQRGRRQGVFALPLEAAGERSEIEQAVEAVKTLAAIALAANVNFRLDHITDQLDEIQQFSAVERLRFLAWRFFEMLDQTGLEETLDVQPTKWGSPGSPGWPSDRDCWETTKKFFWAWDAAIQDDLAARSFGTSSIYQLGRGLAEVFWAYDPDSPPDVRHPEKSPESLIHLLGKQRVDALGVLLDRLSDAVIKSVAAGAITKTLRDWSEYARNNQWRVSGETQTCLEEQGRAWRDLLLMAIEPSEFVDIETMARESRRSRRILVAFRSEGVAALISTGLIAWSASQLSGLKGASATALGVVGLTGSATTGTLKSIYQSTLTQVQRETQEAAVVAMINHVPGAGCRTSPGASDVNGVASEIPPRGGPLKTWDIVLEPTKSGWRAAVPRNGWGEGRPDEDVSASGLSRGDTLTSLRGHEKIRPHLTDDNLKARALGDVPTALRRVDRPLRVKVFTDRYDWLGPAIVVLSAWYFAAQVLVAWVFRPPYNVFDNAISDLGATVCRTTFGNPHIAYDFCSPRWPLMDITIGVLGAALLVGGLLIFTEFRFSQERREQWAAFFGFVFLSIGGLGAILVACVPENLNTWNLHTVGTATTIAAGQLGILILGFVLRSIPDWLRQFMIVTSLVVLLGGIAYAAHSPHQAFGFGGGALERIIQYPQALWLILFGFYISREHWRKGATENRFRFKGVGGGPDKWTFLWALGSIGSESREAL